MNNSKRLEVIREKIKISKLLNDHEKSDWLNLLELMNDKQFGELEEILAAEFPTLKQEEEQAPEPKIPAAPIQPIIKPSPQPVVPPAMPSAPVKAPASKMPPLSHIANIPTGVGVTPDAPAVVTGPNPAAMKASVTQMPPASAPTPVNYAPTPAATETSDNPKPAFSVADVEDLQNISVETIRGFVLQSVVDVIRDAIIENGYFHVLELIEASPLYASYIESGKQLLQNQQSTLTQAEFEFITDLLTHMRFNRV